MDFPGHSVLYVWSGHEPHHPFRRQPEVCHGGNAGLYDDFAHPRGDFRCVAAIILPRFFGLDGLLYSFPLADILTFVFALVVMIRTDRELSSPNLALK